MLTPPKTLPTSIFNGKAKVFIEGQLNDAQIIPIVSTLHGLIEEADIREIQILINSPGGQISVPRLLIAQLNSYRKRKGAVFKIVGCGQVASAAAVTLSFGDIGYRHLITGSFLLFHPCRVHLATDKAVTKDLALMLSQQLQETDSNIAKALAEHAHSLFETKAGKFRFPLRKINQPQFAHLSDSFESISAKAFITRLAEVYLNAFSADTEMFVETAIALGLVDTCSPVIPTQPSGEIQ